YPNLGESGQEGRIEFAWDVIGGQPAGTTSVPGDYDANGLVGGGDFLVWQRRQGALLNSRDDGADIGAIGHELLDIWAGNFGYRQDATRGASITSIPEPGACTLIGLGAALAFFYRHRRFRPLP
ncbi:MAG: hypothetical protein KDA61_19180, partial [Planctomycetales bacterium]|nr:hypothetical protein [Planctomycetales bacterium]